MGGVTFPSRLLQVALDGRLGAGLRLVGVLVALALGPPLTEQVPALVQVRLELTDPAALLLGVLGGLAELVLLVDQRVDAAEDFVLFHARHPALPRSPETGRALTRRPGPTPRGTRPTGR